jgi:hypothetical protein
LRSLEIDVADGDLAAAGMDFARDSLAHATGAAGDQGAAPSKEKLPLAGRVKVSVIGSFPCWFVRCGVEVWSSS